MRSRRSVRRSSEDSLHTLTPLTNTSSGSPWMRRRTTSASRPRKWRRRRSTTPSPHGSQKWMRLSTPSSSSCLNSTSTSIETSRVRVHSNWAYSNSGQPTSDLQPDLRLTALMGTTSTKTTAILGLGAFTP
jgi:hypothetical protein